MIREIIMNEHGLVFHDFIANLLVGGDVRNRFSWVHLKTVLMPSLTTEITFLFGRNRFFRSLPRILLFFDIFLPNPYRQDSFVCNTASIGPRRSDKCPKCLY